MKPWVFLSALFVGISLAQVNSQPVEAVGLVGGRVEARLSGCGWQNTGVFACKLQLSNRVTQAVRLSIGQVGLLDSRGNLFSGKVELSSLRGGEIALNPRQTLSGTISFTEVPLDITLVPAITFAGGLFRKIAVEPLPPTAIQPVKVPLEVWGMEGTFLGCQRSPSRQALACQFKAKNVSGKVLERNQYSRSSYSNIFVRALSRNYYSEKGLDVVDIFPGPAIMPDDEVTFFVDLKLPSPDITHIDILEITVADRSKNVKDVISQNRVPVMR